MHHCSYNTNSWKLLLDSVLITPITALNRRNILNPYKLAESESIDIHGFILKSHEYTVRTYTLCSASSPGCQ